MRYAGALKCVKWVRKLNRYYGMSVKLRSFDVSEAVERAMYYINTSETEVATPRAELWAMEIWLPRLDVVMEPWVVAHEYAHLVQWKDGLLDWHVPHDERFEKIYAECCMVLGEAYIPTREITETVRAAIKRELEAGVGRRRRPDSRGVRE